MAVKAPKVETLAQSMASLDPAYSEQRSLINEQIEGLDSRYGSQREAIEGTRIQAFDDIAEAAAGTGRAFSGIPLHEQSRYLANSYLPGLQAIDERQDMERMQLRTTLAELNSQQRISALSRIDQQTQALNSWNLQQAQIDAQRRENELDRIFRREERIAGQNFSASQSAASAGLTSAQAKSTLVGLMKGGNRRGADGYVSPDAYRRLASQAYAAGIDPDSYAMLMQEFINPRHVKDYVLN